MFCEQCGAEVMPGDQWCTSCGTQINFGDMAKSEGILSNQVLDSVPEQKFCEKCGSPMTGKNQICDVCSALPQSPPQAESMTAPVPISVPPAVAVDRPPSTGGVLLAPKSRPNNKIVLAAAALILIGIASFVIYRYLNSDGQVGPEIQAGNGQASPSTPIPAAERPVPTPQNAAANASSSDLPDSAVDGIVPLDGPGNHSPVPARPAGTKHIASPQPISESADASGRGTGVSTQMESPAQFELPAAASRHRKPLRAQPSVTEEAPPQAAREHPAAAAPPRGVIRWSGEAAKDQTLSIREGIASFGVASGRLPGVPCMITVQPTADIAIAEAPGPGNNYDEIVLRFRKKGRFSITIEWESLH